MIWIIAGIVIATFFGLYTAFEDRDWFMVPVTVLFIMVGAVVGFLIALLIGLPGANVPYKVEYSHPLATLSDSVNSRGSFLGFSPSGTYAFYERTGENSFRMQVVASERATIIETTDEPHVVVEKSHDHLDAWRMRFGDTPRYTFYVPPGSIVMNFKLDAS